MHSREEDDPFFMASTKHIYQYPLSHISIPTLIYDIVNVQITIEPENERTP